MILKTKYYALHLNLSGIGHNDNNICMDVVIDGRNMVEFRLAYENQYATKNVTLNLSADDALKLGNMLIETAERVRNSDLE